MERLLTIVENHEMSLNSEKLVSSAGPCRGGFPEVSGNPLKFQPAS